MLYVRLKRFSRAFDVFDPLEFDRSVLVYFISINSKPTVGSAIVHFTCL